MCGGWLCGCWRYVGLRSGPGVQDISWWCSPTSSKVSKHFHRRVVRGPAKGLAVGGWWTSLMAWWAVYVWIGRKYWALSCFSMTSVFASLSCLSASSQASHRNWWSTRRTSLHKDAGKALRIASRDCWSCRAGVALLGSDLKVNGFQLSRLAYSTH